MAADRAKGWEQADFDRDGDLDVLLTTNNGPAHLFRNDGGSRNHWISVRAVETTVGNSLMAWGIHQEGPAKAWVRQDLDTLLRPHMTRKAQQRGVSRGRAS